MGWVSAILALIQALPQVLKLITMVVEGLRKTPAEERREALSQLDEAIKASKAKEPDLRSISQWLGKRL